jgi:hypothetical protein
MIIRDDDRNAAVAICHNEFQKSAYSRPVLASK